MNVMCRTYVIFIIFGYLENSKAALEKVKNSLFYWNDQLMTWSDHEKFAYDHNLELASIKTSKEQHLIENFFDEHNIRNRRGTFIGGKRYNYNEAFYWSDGSTFGTFVEWHLDEPYYWGKTACVRMVFYQTWGWRSGDCEKDFYGLYRKKSTKSPSYHPSAQFSVQPSFTSLAPSTRSEKPTISLSTAPSTAAGYLQIGSMYLLNEELTTYIKHRKIARQMGYELASIQSKEEDLMLEKFLKNRNFENEEPIYIGATRKKDGAFRWIDGSDFNNFQNWLSNQPNTARNACITIEYKTKWGWDDTGCGRYLMGLYRRISNPKLSITPSVIVSVITDIPLPSPIPSEVPSLIPTAHNHCRAYCFELTFIEWVEKCTWLDCLSCGNCVTSKTCRSWCGTVDRPWSEKCDWSPCDACAECSLPTVQPSLLPSLSTSAPTQTCKAWCYSHVKPWGQKCNWSDCRGCENCITPPPSIVNCKPWCENNPNPWTHPNKKVNQKCSWPQSCGGCPQCQNKE